MFWVSCWLVAIFEAVVTLRTIYLPTPLTGLIWPWAQVIDHLLRLPLRYFERRPVGG